MFKLGEQSQHGIFTADTTEGAFDQCACADQSQHGTISDRYTGREPVRPYKYSGAMALFHARGNPVCHTQRH